MTNNELANTTKRCGRCGQELPLDCFYKATGKSFGRMWECIECSKARQRMNLDVARKHYWERREVKLKRQREYYRENRAAILARGKHRRVEYPEKVIAVEKLNQAIRRGEIARPKICSRCGEEHPRIEAHHCDYSKPLGVVWLCKKCHAAIHSHASDCPLAALLEGEERNPDDKFRLKPYTQMEAPDESLP